jgi:lysophospholipase L1-like esterase
MRIYVFIGAVSLLVLIALGSTFAMLLRYRASWRAAMRESERLRQETVDWPQLRFYNAANAALPPAGPRRIVFIGDSITNRWDLGKSFPEIEPINRGIGWQTTSEMLVRMRSDVINLQPVAVVILGGSNDFHVECGPMSLVSTQNNIQSMVELARQHGIVVLVGTIPPVNLDCTNRSSQEGFVLESAQKYNEWLRTFCTAEQCTVVDYERALRTAGGPCMYLSDASHPNEKGYEVMTQAVRRALSLTLARRR